MVFSSKAICAIVALVAIQGLLVQCSPCESSQEYVIDDHDAHAQHENYNIPSYYEYEYAPEPEKCAPQPVLSCRVPEPKSCYAPPPKPSCRAPEPKVCCAPPPPAPCRVPEPKVCYAPPPKPSCRVPEPKSCCAPPPKPSCRVPEPKSCCAPPPKPSCRVPEPKVCCAPPPPAPCHIPEPEPCCAAPKPSFNSYSESYYQPQYDSNNHGSHGNGHNH